MHLYHRLCPIPSLTVQDDLEIDFPKGSSNHEALLKEE